MAVNPNPKTMNDTPAGTPATKPKRVRPSRAGAAAGKTKGDKKTSPGAKAQQGETPAVRKAMAATEKAQTAVDLTREKYEAARLRLGECRTAEREARRDARARPAK